jgi:hypothetical protein
MADAGGSRLNIGTPVKKRGRGRPRGSKNKPTILAVVALSSAPTKRRPGRSVGTKNKPKVSSTTPGPSACYSVMAPENMLWRVMVVGADVLVRGE